MFFTLMKPMADDQRSHRRQITSWQLIAELQRTRRLLSMKEFARLLHRKLTPRERYELIRYLNQPNT